MKDAPSTTAIETWVIATCRTIGVNVAAATDDFFLVGGTSLSALRLIAKIEHAYGEGALPPEDLFERSSIRDIASRINAALATIGPPAAASGAA